MQITSNTTGMEAGMCVSTNKDGYDFCVVVVKGTYRIENGETLALAQEQAPLVYSDEHYGDPSSTPIKYESDFCPYKPNVDILINGHAYSETGIPVRETIIGLDVGEIRKIAKVFGDRIWISGITGYTMSEPEPFIRMPITYSRAFGGIDDSHENQKHNGAELRNLSGVGYIKNSDSQNIEGTALPNFEAPSSLIKNWTDKPAPMCFGIVGRGCKPRIKYAGTYDKRWLDECFPFLPQDFSEQYFHSAAEDQQLPSLNGGEVIRCLNMTPDSLLTFNVPTVDVSIEYVFRDKQEHVKPILDTVIIEPDEQRVLLIWRCKIALGRKLNALREIKVGGQREDSNQRLRNGKPYFKSIEEFILWKKGRGL